jgi:glyoxylase-like metal-dependent hydrolase (beta-lactamase superfamily II)
MKIDHLILGAYETNCYILRANDHSEDCVIIDTGLGAEVLLDFLEANNIAPAAVVLTHGHADHITGVALLREKYPDIKVYIHRLDAGMLTGEQFNLSELVGIRFHTEAADYIVEEANIIEQAGMKLEVLHTPGHTPGGISLYSRDDGIVFSGDTLFAGSVGRTDFPGGDTEQLINSIKEKLLRLPEQTIVYTGHGPSTIIGLEKTHNPFLQ